MKKTLCCIAAASCLAVAAPLTWAEDDGMPRRGDFAEKMFKEMDTNGDGVVSKAEFNAYHSKRFDEMDTNHDGKITREEMEAARDKMRGKIGEHMREQFNQRFDEADANHDGALSKEEAKKMPRVSEHFDEIDANHDGKVSREEIRAYMEKLHGQDEGMHGEGRQGDDMHGGGMMRRSDTPK